VDGRDGSDRAADVVRGDGDAVAVTEGGDPAELQQAAAVHLVGGGDVHPVGFEHLVELAGVAEVLAGEDRGVHLGGDPPVGVVLPGRAGILQPRQVVRFEFPPEAGCGLDGEVPVEVEAEVDLVTDLLADGLDKRDLVLDGVVVEPARGGVHVAVGAHVEVELQRLEPVVDHLAGRAGVGLGGVDVAGIAVGLLGGAQRLPAVGVTVNPDAVAVLPAHEFVGGDAVDLPLEVPQRHLDAGTDPVFDQPLDVERVLSLQQARALWSVAVDLSDAVDVGVGLDFHETPPKVALQDHRAHVGDLEVALGRAAPLVGLQIAPRHPAAGRDDVVGNVAVTVVGHDGRGDDRWPP